MPQVIKSNGTRVAFNPHKLRTSLERALHKRPIAQEKIDETVALIEQRLYQSGNKEVPSRMVGGNGDGGIGKNRSGRLCPFCFRV